MGVRGREGDSVKLIILRSYLKDFGKLNRISYPEKDIMAIF